MNLSALVTFKRKELGLTQEKFAKRVGVGLRFIRELEQGKESLKMDKVKEVLDYLGYELVPAKKVKE